jgi:hypothetical protein
VPGVLNVIAATRLTNAHAKSEEAIMFLTNFVFIGVIFFRCFGLLWLLVIEKPFLAFTEVQNGNRYEVMRKMQKP